MNILFKNICYWILSIFVRIFIVIISSLSDELFMTQKYYHTHYIIWPFHQPFEVDSTNISISQIKVKEDSRGQLTCESLGLDCKPFKRVLVLLLFSVSLIPSLWLLHGSHVTLRDGVENELLGTRLISMFWLSIRTCLFL